MQLNYCRLMLAGELPARSVQQFPSWLAGDFEVALQSNTNRRMAVVDCLYFLIRRRWLVNSVVGGRSTQRPGHVCMIGLHHFEQVMDCHPCHSCLWVEYGGRGHNNSYSR